MTPRRVRRPPLRAPARATAGLTVLELIIALSILLVLLSVLASYFSSQARMTSFTQARTEVQDKVRFLSQVLAQDLQLAGASRYVTSANAVVKLDESVFTPCAATNYCLAVPSNVNASGTRDAFQTRYITSLRSQATACRQVAYSWNGTTNTLQRSDVTCGSAASPSDLAANVIAVNLRYLCSDSTTSDTALGCLGATPSSPVAYPRSVRIDVYAASDNAFPGAAPASFTLATGASVACPARRVCFGLSQEIGLPNLKDK